MKCQYKRDKNPWYSCSPKLHFVAIVTWNVWSKFLMYHHLLPPNQNHGIIKNKKKRRECSKPDKVHNSAKTPISFQFDHGGHEQPSCTLDNQSTTLPKGKSHYPPLHPPPSQEWTHKRHQPLVLNLSHLCGTFCICLSFHAGIWCLKEYILHGFAWFPPAVLLPWIYNGPRILIDTKIKWQT